MTQQNRETLEALAEGREALALETMFAGEPLWPVGTAARRGQDRLAALRANLDPTGEKA